MATNVRYSAQRLVQPQADRLDALEQRRRRAGRSPTSRSVPERSENSLSSSCRIPTWPEVLHRAAGDAALEVGEDPVVGVAQAGSSRGEQQHGDAEQAEDRGSGGAVDRDQPQHDLVAQRLAAQRDLDLDRGRAGVAGRLRRAAAVPPSCRSAGSGASGGRRCSRTTSASSGADLARRRAPTSAWPADAARDQLPVDLAPRRGGGWVPGGRCRSLTRPRRNASGRPITIARPDERASLRHLR